MKTIGKLKPIHPDALKRLEQELIEKGQMKPTNQLHMELAKGARG